MQRRGICKADLSLGPKNAPDYTGRVFEYLAGAHGDDYGRSVVGQRAVREDVIGRLALDKPV